MKFLLISILTFSSIAAFAHNGDEITGFSSTQNCSYSVFKLRQEALQDAISRLNVLECDSNIINTGLKIEVLSSFEYKEEIESDCKIHSQVTIEGVCK